MASRKQIPKTRTSPLLGAHFSIARGLHQAFYTARDYDCTAIQVFTKNASTWKEREVSDEEVERFERARAETGIGHVASHTSYLINLASPDKDKHRSSCQALEKELLRSSALGIGNVVLHPGAHMGSGVEKGIRRISQGIRRVMHSSDRITSRLLLETTAGQGSSIGHTFDQLAAILQKAGNISRLGICLDTSHVFAAGYDIRTSRAYRKTVAEFDRIIGLEQLFLIHLNDSKKDLGTRVDRHENIGHGFIGIKAFDCIMNDRRLAQVPKIIETPKMEGKKNWDRTNLRRLRKLIRA